jgi:hypothetical protein
MRVEPFGVWQITLRVYVVVNYPQGTRCSDITLREKKRLTVVVMRRNFVLVSDREEQSRPTNKYPEG